MTVGDAPLEILEQYIESQGENNWWIFEITKTEITSKNKTT